MPDVLSSGAILASLATAAPQSDPALVLVLVQCANKARAENQKPLWVGHSVAPVFGFVQNQHQPRAIVDVCKSLKIIINMSSSNWAQQLVRFAIIAILFAIGTLNINEITGLLSDEPNLGMQLDIQASSWSTGGLLFWPVVFTAISFASLIVFCANNENHFKLVSENAPCRLARLLARAPTNCNNHRIQQVSVAILLAASCYSFYVAIQYNNNSMAVMQADGLRKFEMYHPRRRNSIGHKQAIRVSLTSLNATCCGLHNAQVWQLTNGLQDDSSQPFGCCHIMVLNPCSLGILSDSIKDECQQHIQDHSRARRDLVSWLGLMYFAAATLCSLAAHLAAQARSLAKLNSIV